MLIDLQARDFPLTDALQQHAERRLHYALSRNDACIIRIIVRLSDVNGPRGGNDKRCHLQLILSGMPDLVIEDTESDMYDAINRATSRAGRTLTRRLKRHLPRRGNERATDALTKVGH